MSDSRSFKPLTSPKHDPLRAGDPRCSDGAPWTLAVGTLDGDHPPELAALNAKLRRHRNYDEEWGLCHFWMLMKLAAIDWVKNLPILPQSELKFLCLSPTVPPAFLDSEVARTERLFSQLRVPREHFDPAGLPPRARFNIVAVEGLGSRVAVTDGKRIAYSDGRVEDIPEHELQVASEALAQVRRLCGDD